MVSATSQSNLFWAISNFQRVISYIKTSFTFLPVALYLSHSRLLEQDRVIQSQHGPCPSPEYRPAFHNIRTKSVLLPYFLIYHDLLLLLPCDYHQNQLLQPHLVFVIQLIFFMYWSTCI